MQPSHHSLCERRCDSLRVFLMLLTVMDFVLVFLGLPERLLLSIMRPSFLNFLIIYWIVEDGTLFVRLANKSEFPQCVQINNAYSFLCAHLTHFYHNFLFVKWELLTSFMVVYNGWTRPISTGYKHLALAEQPRVKMITLMMDHTNKTCSNTFSKLRSCFFCS